MTLQELLNSASIGEYQLTGNGNCPINSLCIDSRNACPGALFIAMRGTKTDGHNFISNAVNAGVSAVLCETLPHNPSSNITWICVNNTTNITGQIASAFYGHPSHSMTIVGVTGTNGKTTIATLLYNLWQNTGHKAGLLSTVCNYIDRVPQASTHTTPDPLELQELLFKMKQAGCSYVFMEVSSHAAHQKRIGGIRFAGGIFTNLTRDHLDYHKTMDAYLSAKKSFFDQLENNAFALTNADDKHGMVMLQNTAAKTYTYACERGANFMARILETSFNGMLLKLDGEEVYTPFVGNYNASNLLAVYGAARLLGMEKHSLLQQLSLLQPVCGRMQTIYGPKQQITAIVDFAHTPDALGRVLETLGAINKGQQKGRIITVVGCGGDRDKGKRPLMAREAFKGSNRLILTSDNPRTETPSDILSDMLAGLNPNEQKQVLVIENRQVAIQTACLNAQAGDVILVAGKGHENYQEINGVKYPFSDIEELNKYID